jgi:hypothetical protein
MDEKFEGSKPERLKFVLKEARNKRMRSRKIKISLQRRMFIIFLLLVLILLAIIIFSPDFLNFLQNQEPEELQKTSDLSQIFLIDDINNAEFSNSNLYLQNL